MGSKKFAMHLGDKWQHQRGVCVCVCFGQGRVSGRMAMGGGASEGWGLHTAGIVESKQD